MSTYVNCHFLQCSLVPTRWRHMVGTRSTSLATALAPDSCNAIAGASSGDHHMAPYGGHQRHQSGASAGTRSLTTIWQHW